MRWLVLASLLYAIYRAYKGYTLNTLFSKTDNAVRHWTATIAHIQLVIGIILYTQSPIIKYFWHNFNDSQYRCRLFWIDSHHSDANSNHFNYHWIIVSKKKYTR